MGQDRSEPLPLRLTRDSWSAALLPTDHHRIALLIARDGDVASGSGECAIFHCIGSGLMPARSELGPMNVGSCKPPQPPSPNTPSWHPGRRFCSSSRAPSATIGIMARKISASNPPATGRSAILQAGRGAAPAHRRGSPDPSAPGTDRRPSGGTVRRDPVRREVQSPLLVQLSSAWRRAGAVDPKGLGMAEIATRPRR